MKEAYLERLLHCPPELHGRRHRRAAPPIPPPLSAVRPLDSSPGNSGQRRSPPCRDCEAGKAGRGERFNPFYRPIYVPGLRGARRARGRAGPSRPTPRCWERRQPCRGFFPGGAEGYTPSPAADAGGPPMRGEVTPRDRSPGGPAPTLTRSSSSWSNPKLGLRGQSGSGIGGCTRLRGETHSPKGWWEARPGPSPNRHRDPPSSSSFSSWEIGGVYGAPGRRLAG